jgi:hypothetical protein
MKNPKRFTLTVLVASSLVTLLVLPDFAYSQSAEANDKAAKSTTDKAQAQKKSVEAKKKDPLLTKDQLRECVAQEASTKSEGQAMALEQAALDQLKASIGASDTDLAERRSSLDPLDAAAREGIEEQSRQLDRKIDDYNARLPAFNLRAQAYQSATATWKANCSNRRFEEADLQAIKRARQ